MKDEPIKENKILANEEKKTGNMKTKPILYSKNLVKDETIERQIVKQKKVDTN